MKKDKSLIVIRNEAARELGLTLKEQAFCDLYVNSSEYRGNGVRSYAKAFNIDLEKRYHTAVTNASRLLVQPHILQYINVIFEHCGLTDVAVDNELLFVIRQNADFGSKVAAIKLYCQLKGRLEKTNGADNKIQFQINIGPFKEPGTPFIEIEPNKEEPGPD